MWIVGMDIQERKIYENWCGHAQLKTCIRCLRFVGGCLIDTLASKKDYVANWRHA
jgi:hypothetical protein